MPIFQAHLLINGWRASPQKLLFLCFDNSILSQMAEAYLRTYAGGRFEVFSAGLEPREIHPLTYQVMAEAGLDLSQHASKGIDEFIDKVLIHTLITLGDAAEENSPTVWPGVSRRLFWRLPDPSAKKGAGEDELNAFRAVRDQIDAQVRSWLVEQHTPRPA